MASFTSSQSGLWSSASTWGGAGVPGNGDTVTIASGHTVTFDVDQSSFASGLAGLTVNGTLKFKEDVVTCLKMANDVEIIMGVSGNLVIGDENNFIHRPPSGLNYRARIILQGTGRINCYSGSPSSKPTVKMVGWTPPLNYTTLSANASSGSTQIQLANSLDLQSGDRIVIGTGNINGVQTETQLGVYTVQSVSSDGKTVTLTEGLGHNRLVGDYVAWYSRPILVSGNTLLFPGHANFKAIGTHFTTFLNDGNNPLYPLSSPMISYSTLSSGITIHHGDNILVKDSTMYKTRVIRSGSSKHENCIFIQGISNDVGFYETSTGLFSKNCIFQNGSTLFASYADVGKGLLYIENPIFKNLYRSPLYYTGTVYSKNSDYSNTTLFLSIEGVFDNCYLTNTAFDLKWVPIFKNIQSFNHNQVDGAYRAWMRGGTIQSITNEYPPCGNKSYQYTLISNTIPVHRTLQLGILQPQQTIQLSCWLKKTVSNMSIQPRFQLIDNNNDPLIDPSAQPLQEAISSTSISNQWEELTIRYKNNTDKEIPISVRCLAANSTGFIYEYINLDRIFYMSNVFG